MIYWTLNSLQVSIEQHYPVLFDSRKAMFLGRWELKIKESRNRPGVAQGVPGSLGSQIFMIFGTWTWWGCQPHAPAAFTPRKCPRYSFPLGAEFTLGPWYGRKEICHWKIPWHHRESIPGPSVLVRVVCR